MKTSWQVATAGEAFAAAQFARCGWDVSVQYGANQPEYDLVVVDGTRFLKVSVKASKKGEWGLAQSQMRKGQADYQGAINDWQLKHTNGTIFCFVQFAGTSLNELPRLYLATPEEVGQRLRSTAGGRGDTILYERKVWTVRAKSAGTTDEIPQNWKFSEERINELVGMVSLQEVQHMPTRE